MIGHPQGIGIWAAIGLRSSVSFLAEKVFFTVKSLDSDEGWAHKGLVTVYAICLTAYAIWVCFFGVVTISCAIMRAC